MGGTGRGGNEENNRDENNGFTATKTETAMAASSTRVAAVLVLALAAAVTSRPVVRREAPPQPPPRSFRSSQTEASARLSHLVSWFFRTFPIAPDPARLAPLRRLGVPYAHLGAGGPREIGLVLAGADGLVDRTRHCPEPKVGEEVR